jgi:exopolyphosphatase/guanosine-5'-triphosphate,3'-diphosphate pyrophosphatase
VVDLGGGSTEWVRGEETVESACSMDIGSVRLTERHLHSDPPQADEVAAAVRDIDAALDRAAEVVDLTGIGSLVGLAGSVTTITAHALGLQEYDPGRIHLAELSPGEVLAACEDLLHRTREQRAVLGFMHPGRVDVIGAGALVWHQVVQRLAGLGVGRVVTSEHDILDGIAASAAERLASKA